MEQWTFDGFEILIDPDAGIWEAFLPEGLPPIIDDCIKGHILALFQEALSKVSPDDIYDMLPMTLPKTHIQSIMVKC